MMMGAWKEDQWWEAGTAGFPNHAEAVIGNRRQAAAAFSKGERPSCDGARGKADGASLDAVDA